MALSVGMTQLRVIQGETSFEELPRSDWPVGKSVSCEDKVCLHCQVTEEDPAPCGCVSLILWQVTLDYMSEPQEALLSAPSFGF